MKLKNKKIGIWGFGTVGRAAANFLSEKNAIIKIYDDAQISTHHPQAHTKLELFDWADAILPSPGVDISPYLKKFKGTWLNELDLFAHYFKKKIIATTGTLGKTSVTHGLNYVLQHNGIRSIAAGNIGLPCLSIINNQHNLDMAVLEVSSFQLEHCKTFAPDIAIWTNFYPNHLDRHKTIEEYFASKLLIALHQKKHQVALLPYEFKKKFSTLQSRCMFHKQTYNHTKEYFTGILAANSYLIKKTLKLIGIRSHKLIIPPLEHRLEPIVTKFGLTFINDSKSTTPESTVGALEQFKHNNMIVLIGGLNKGIDRSLLLNKLIHYNVIVVFFGKEDAFNLYQKAQSKSFSSFYFPTLSDSLNFIRQQNFNNSVVLFSPAGSSFDLYSNYIERGNDFKRLVRCL